MAPDDTSGSKPPPGYERVETGDGAYRRAPVDVPIPPHVSRMAIAAALSLAAGLVLLVLVFAGVAKSDSDLYAYIALVVVCLVCSHMLARTARRRMEERPELRGQSMARVVGVVTRGSLGCVAVLFALFIGLLLFFLHSDFTMGRPLRRAGRATRIRPRRGAGSAVRGRSGETGRLRRWVLARLWTRAASLEHSAVAAFAQLGEQLRALGAPPELIERMQRARREEADHARRCFRLASRWSGRVVAPGRMPRIERRPPPLDRLVAEQVRDGCLMEAYAAAMAREGARTACDEEVRSTLAVIAVDEARHAEDAYAIVAWLLSNNDPGLVHALRRELEDLPTRAPQLGPLWAHHLDLSAHGFPDRVTAEELFSSTRATVTRRVGAMLQPPSLTDGTVPRGHRLGRPDGSGLAGFSRVNN